MPLTLSYYLPNETQGTEGWELDVRICSLLSFLPLLPWNSFARMPQHCQNPSPDAGSNVPALRVLHPEMLCVAISSPHRLQSHSWSLPA